MPFRRSLFPVVCLLWAGACIGLAFAEAEKFRAPSLSRNAAIDVGRTVFHAWQEVQFGPMVLVLVGAIGGRLPRSAWACVTVAWTVFLFQNVLLQALLAQADTLLAGGVPQPSSAHALYVGCEVLKVLALVAAAMFSLRTAEPIPNQGGSRSA